MNCPTSPPPAKHAAKERPIVDKGSQPLANLGRRPVEIREIAVDEHVPSRQHNKIVNNING